MSDRPIAVDLFSGVGGMGLGFEQAGFDVVAAVERDPAHAGAHRFNFPRCEVLEADASNLDLQQLRDGVVAGLRRHGRTVASGQAPQIDVVFGGPPCQGFSVGGLMDASDPRNQLVEVFVRTVERLRPRAFVMENVPAMASRVLPQCAKPIPAWMEGRLRKSGYKITACDVLNASRYGVPQDRRRLLLIGVLRDEQDIELPAATTAAVPKRPTRTVRPGEHGHASTSRELAVGPTVLQAIGDLPDLDAFDELLRSDTVRLDDAQLAASRRARSTYAKVLAGDLVAGWDLSAPRVWDPAVLSSSLRTTHAADVVVRFQATAQGTPETTSRFYRLHPAGLAPTLRAGSGPDNGSFSAPRPIHHAHPRVISVREAARLHGFPDWFRLSGAKWHGFRQVGNAVPPPLARAVAQSVRDGLGYTGSTRPEPVELGKDEQLRVANGSGRRRRRKLAVEAPAPATHDVAA